MTPTTREGGREGGKEGRREGGREGGRRVSERASEHSSERTIWLRLGMAQGMLRAQVPRLGISPNNYDTNPSWDRISRLAAPLPTQRPWQHSFGVFMGITAAPQPSRHRRRGRRTTRAPMVACRCAQVGPGPSLLSVIGLHCGLGCSLQRCRRIAHALAQRRPPVAPVVVERVVGARGPWKWRRLLCCVHAW